MNTDLFSTAESQMKECSNPKCSKLAIPGNGYFPFCSKSCKNAVDYQKRRKYEKLLNEVKSEVRQQDNALDKAYKIYQSNDCPAEIIIGFGYVDGAYKKRVHYEKLNRKVFLFGKYGIYWNVEMTFCNIYLRDDIESNK